MLSVAKTTLLPSNASSKAIFNSLNNSTGPSGTVNRQTRRLLVPLKSRTQDFPSYHHIALKNTCQVDCLILDERTAIFELYCEGPCDAVCYARKLCPTQHSPVATTKQVSLHDGFQSSNDYLSSLPDFTEISGKFWPGFSIVVGNTMYTGGIRENCVEISRSPPN